MRTGDAAVVLLSGGLDSATVLAQARADGYRVHALSFRYGQRHVAELAAAARVASAVGVERHVIAEIDLRVFGGSALTSDDLAVPKRQDAGAGARARAGAGAAEHVDPADEIPVTYVPARNTIFLAYALALAEVTHASDVFIGVNAVDYSGYPDCRPEFIEAFERMANLATKAAVEGRAVRIRTPLIDLTKAQIIERGVALGLDHGLTVSCYDADADGRACGECDSCRLRHKGFLEAGLPDPTAYRPGAAPA